MRRFLSLSILAFFTFLAAYPAVAFAGEGKLMWGANGVPVCETDDPKENIRMVADGFGGTIIVWQVVCSGHPIFAQRINENGMRLWSQNGVLVHTGGHDHLCPAVVGDGFGGAIIAWEDYEYGVPNIYALRISSDTGASYPGWPADGIPLMPDSMLRQKNPEIVSDGSGGAVGVWWEKNNMEQYLIRGQRVEGNGTIGSWTSSGKTLTSPTVDQQEFPKIVSDGMGYVFITWQLWSATTSYDIFAHKISIANGSPSWAMAKQVTSRPTNEKFPEIVIDGQGGVVITWIDGRAAPATAPDIYAQRIDSNGNPQWAPDGVAICDENENQTNPVIATTLLAGTTQFIIAWEDERNKAIPNMQTDIYAEKIELSPMPGEDRLIAGGLGYQLGPKVVGDNQGGGIGCWIYEVGGSIFGILAQRYDSDGYPMWSYNPGLPVCSNLCASASNYKDSYRMVNDGGEGVIVAWISTPNYRIYAQRVIDSEVSLKSASISGRILRLSDKKGITGVEVWAIKDNRLIAQCITDTNGTYGLDGLAAGSIYMVRANWRINDIESSVSMGAIAPSSCFDFTLEIDYELATVAGSVSGVEEKYIAGLSSRQLKGINGAGLQAMLSPGNGIAFVELQQKGKVIARVPVEGDGTYTIPNLLPGRFIARAYNGTIYSDSRIVDLKEGKTLRVDFAFGIIPEETVFSYPNPAKSGSTTIRYYCGYSEPEAEIRIYDIAGGLVKKIEDKEIDKADAPIYRFLWNCKNSSDEEVSSGIYIYTVEVKEKSSNETKKVMKKMAVVR